jgi:polysaccharide pyruvyl transferase WcaK-like protein
LEVLHKIVRNIQEANYDPIFLIHEGEKDLLLAKDVNREYSLDIGIIKEDDPLIVKGIIGQVQGIVTSRFHGLVSGLSQAIPSLCIGWSHKYKALLEDYNVSEALINKDDLVSEDHLSSKLNLILLGESRSNVIDVLKRSSAIEKAKSEEMWEQVFKVIGR